MLPLPTLIVNPRVSLKLIVFTSVTVAASGASTVTSPADALLIRRFVSAVAKLWRFWPVP